MSSILRQALCIISNTLVNSYWSYSPETLDSGWNWRYFVLYDLKIWRMTLENNRTPFLYYIKLCAPFQTHLWSQTWVTVWKHSIRVKFFFLSRVTMKFDGWPWKTIGHLSYTTLSFVHHFKSIGEVKIRLQSGNTQFGSKRQFFVPCDIEIWRMTLKNNRAPLLEIWRMTLKNNRAPLLSNIKLCASFHCHMWIQTGVTVQKQLSGVMTIVTLTFCMDITSVNGNISWKFQDDTITGTLSKGVTDGQMEKKCS